MLGKEKYFLWKYQTSVFIGWITSFGMSSRKINIILGDGSYPMHWLLASNSVLYILSYPPYSCEICRRNCHKNTMSIILSSAFLVKIAAALCSCLLPESLQVTSVKQLPEYHECSGVYISCYFFSSQSTCILNGAF